MLLALVGRRVLIPNAGLPHGVTGFARPIGERPSPPPCGWSLGFLTIPLTCGLFPNQRLQPAFPSRRLANSTFPTCPKVA